MKRLLICIMLCSICFLTACYKEKTIETYKYSNDEILSMAITKTSVYSDRIVLHFTEDSISSVDNVACYSSDFNLFEKDVEFKLMNDSLAIYSENASQISGLRIDVDSNLYLEIRYLDSERYAMIVNSWADDLGYEENGDLDTYYTDEEKKRQEEIKAEHEAYQTECFALVEGLWEDEDGTVRVEFYYDDGDRMVSVYKNTEGNWTLTNSFYACSVSKDEESEPVSVYIEDGVGYSCRYSFLLYNDNTEMETDFTDKSLKKIQ